MRAREGLLHVRRARRRPEEDPADHPRRRQRHGHLRQRARVPRHDRAVAAARDPDDDPRAVAEQRRRCRAELQGVLRIPLVADGAVGRPGVDRVHRRHGDRRRARPQRPAAVALLRDEGRPRRSWRPRSACSTSRPRTSCSRSGCTRAASSWSTPRAAASCRTTRSSASWRPAQPYREWLTHLIDIEDLDPAPYLPPPSHETVLRRQQLFGYTHEDLRLLLGADGDQGRRSRSARWAPTRRSRCCRIGRGCSTTTSSRCSRRSPTRRSTRSARSWSPRWSRRSGRRATCSIRARSRAGRSRSSTRSSTTTSWRSCGTSTTRVPRDRGCRCCSTRAQDGPGLERALEDLKRARERRGRGRLHILILSDRDADRDRAPIPSLLATAGVHHHLVRQGTRTRCALVVESGDAREVHHCALLLGYGAGAVNPYLAFETLDDMIRQRHAGRHHAREGGQELHQGAQQGHPQGDVQDGHLDAAELLRRADLRGGRPRSRVRRQVLHPHRVAHRRRRHRRSSPRKSAGGTSGRFPSGRSASTSSTWGGEYQWRRDGEYHLFNPDTVFKLQHATRSGQYAIFKEYTRLVDDQSEQLRDAARPARAEARAASRSRSTRSSRSSRSSSASRPARCRTARSARKRTRRSPSR